MKPLLVHIHIFHTEFWSELKACLGSIGTLPYDLYVTMVEEHKEIQRDILSVKSDAQIQILENRGFDIGSFMHVINQVDLDKYSYIIKLHTKRDTRFRVLAKHLWRQYLLNFIRDSESFKRTLDIFDSDKNIGMVGGNPLILRSYDFKETKRSQEQAENIILSLGLELKNKEFIAGTMFIVRAPLFKELQHTVSINDFLISKQTVEETLAHVYERLFGYIVLAHGYSIKGSMSWKYYSQHLMIYSLCQIKRFFYRDYINKKNERVMKIFQVVVLSRKKLKKEEEPIE